MAKEKIFIVEDDEGIREVYSAALENLYDIYLFESASSFFKEYNIITPDLIILDVMLPDKSGFDILEEIRKKDMLLPVIIVSAKTDEISHIKGLNKGADDYISKPFKVMELLARVKTNLRRFNYMKNSIGEFEIDLNLYKIKCNGEDLNLTNKEFALLKLFIECKSQTLTREDIFKRVWGEDFLGETRTLDLHVSQLREKLSKCGCLSEIATVRGIGYRLDINEKQ